MPVLRAVVLRCRCRRCVTRLICSCASAADMRRATSERCGDVRYRRCARAQPRSVTLRTLRAARHIALQFDVVAPPLLPMPRANTIFFLDALFAAIFIKTALPRYASMPPDERACRQRACSLRFFRFVDIVLRLRRHLALLRCFTHILRRFRYACRC